MIPSLFRRTRRHRHDWYYGAATATGWVLATCRICGKTDLCHADDVR